MGKPSTYVALLRGINVSGQRKVPMAELREVFDRLGHADVRTYIQSGNVVFVANAGAPMRVKVDIEQAIERQFRFAVGVILRSPIELKAMVKRNPYGDSAYVTFLDKPPSKSQVAALDPKEFAPDEYEVQGREIFVQCPNGYGRTKINNAYFERKLSTQATTRNWKTVTTLLDWATG